MLRPRVKRPRLSATEEITILPQEELTIMSEKKRTQPLPTPFRSSTPLRASQQFAKRVDTHSNGIIPKVAGRLAGVELENFMCHAQMRLTFNVEDRNCYYIIGTNGSGKSAIFAAINIALGGKGRANDRGNSLQAYIKEGKTYAKVRVILTNEGGNKIPDFAEQIVIERSITFSSTSYAIKSRRREGGHEEVRSRKKCDLDRILNRFFIELENPLSWLSQDRARQFLQSMKPEKLYEIFMISSELDSTRQIYEQIFSYQEEVKQHIESGEKKKNELKKQYEDLLIRYKAKVKIEELGKRLSRAQWQKLWADIRDKSIQIDSEYGKLHRLEEKKAEFEASQKTFDTRHDELNSEKRELEQKIDNLREELCEAKNVHKQHGMTLANTERDIVNARNICSKKQSEQKSIEHELMQTRQQLDNLLGNSGRDLATEEMQLNQRKESTMSELDSLKESITTHQYGLEAHEERVNKCIKRLKDCEFQIDESRNQLDKIEQDKVLFISAQKNRLNLLGENILPVKQLIHANRNRFYKLPIGPIGEYVKIQDAKWARPVEFCLRNMLNNFICDSTADRKLFEQLCAQHRIRQPDLITTSHVNEKVKTTAFEPSPELTTVLRIVDISNPTVYNAVVDQLNIESTLLMERDSNARHLMQKNPPQNVRMTFTLACSQVYPRLLDVPYRFYSNNNAPEARFFASKGGSDWARRDFSRERQILEQKIPTLQKLSFEAQAEVAAAQNELRLARESFQAMTRRKSELENVLLHLDEKYQELQKVLGSATVIENFKATLAESEKIRDRIVGEIEDAKRNLCNREDEKNRINAEMREAQNRLKQIDGISRNLEVQLNNNSKKIEDLLDERKACENKLQKCQQIRQKIEDKIEALQREKGTLTEKCVNEKGNYHKPDELTDPPDLEQIPETHEIVAKIKEYKQQRDIQEQYSQDQAPTIEEVERVREMGKTQQRRLREFRNYLKRFSDAVEIRRQKFNLLKFMLPRELEKGFREQMLLRSYNGTLFVDHDNKAIVVTVETHKDGCQDNVSSGPAESADDATGLNNSQRREFVGPAQSRLQSQRYLKSKTQDLRGLSGGERSYTTTCFVMALWRCIESPFRCLDEFDVFMDMLNRRVVMEMLVDFTVENKRNQFFFFTPQGINELRGRSNIEIFNLPRVRDI